MANSHLNSYTQHGLHSEFIATGSPRRTAISINYKLFHKRYLLLTVPAVSGANKIIFPYELNGPL